MNAQRGGPGRGQGRKPVAEGHTTVSVSLRMTESQRDKLALLGGAEWVRQRIDKAKAPNAALRGAEGVPLESTVMQEENMTDVILENPNGVQILESVKFHGHYGAANATCQCGEELIVAPPIFHPDHKKGDPVMVCGDHGVHGYRFSTLVVGRQPTGSAEKCNA